MNLIFATIVTLIWTAPVEGPGVGGTVQGYKVYVGDTVKDVGNVTTTTVDLDLTKATQIQVSAYNKVEGEKSAPIVVGKPGAPTGLAVK